MKGELGSEEDTWRMGVEQEVGFSRLMVKIC